MHRFVPVTRLRPGVKPHEAILTALAFGFGDVPLQRYGLIDKVLTPEKLKGAGDKDPFF